MYVGLFENIDQHWSVRENKTESGMTNGNIYDGLQDLLDLQKHISLDIKSGVNKLDGLDQILNNQNRFCTHRDSWPLP